MGNFFSIDSKFFHFMTKVADCMILSVLWLLFSFPVVTAGAATVALYFSVVKILREEEGTIWRSFWGSFKTNFKQATIISVPALLAGSFWVQVLEAMAVNHQGGEPLYLVALVLLGITIMWLHYILSYLARFTDTIRVTLRNTFLICLGNLPNSLLMLALFATVVIVLYMIQPINPFLFLLVPSLYVLVVSLILERIYSKYNTAAPEESTSNEV